MNSYLVKESPRVIKSIARDALRGNWMIAIAASLIYLVLSQGITSLFDHYIGLGSISYSMNGVVMRQSMISYIYDLIMPGIIYYGFIKFFLCSFRLRDTRIENSFDGFDNFAKAIALLLVQRFFIFMWSLLFIVPGIIASYKYSLAYYILVDDPDKGIMECIRESKARMNGNKMNLFSLNLSYIGWLILASIPVVLMMGLAKISIYGPFDPSKVIIASLINFVGVFPIAAVCSYLKMGETVFYELQSGHLVANQGEGDECQLDRDLEDSGQLIDHRYNSEEQNVNGKERVSARPEDKEQVLQGQEGIDVIDKVQEDKDQEENDQNERGEQDKDEAE